MIDFSGSNLPTIGVELELQLINNDTGNLYSIAPLILQEIHEEFKGKIKEEFLMSMIEVNTAVCKTVAEVEQDLKNTLLYLEDILSSHNASFLSASLHPFAKGTDQIVSTSDRYKKIMDDLQIVGRRFIAQGLHIHIGVRSAERAIRINNTIRIYLPLLLALSTSSPFYEGEPTGLMSYRTKLFEALPRSGMPEHIDNWDEFIEMVLLLHKAGYITTVRDLWWDVRPHPEFGTVEIRICDIPCKFRDILAITALVQCLVVYLDSIERHPRAYVQVLRANKWQAARYGLEGIFANPIKPGIHPIKEAIKDLVTLLERQASELDCTQYLHSIHDILQTGTGAHRQLAMYNSGYSFNDIIQGLQKEFYS